MDLPKQIKQHKAESDSYAILLYKLRDVGIFRNMTENDYGIDFEIEFVKNGKVIGHYLKAQVKSSDNLTIRQKDLVPTISGIKQSTLHYWAQLSYKCHVIAYAVDLKNEEIYITKPLFWDAIAKLDQKGSTKTIEFLPHQPQLTSQSELAKAFTNIYSILPSLQDEIYNHKLALKSLNRFIELYADVFHYDVCCEVNNQDDFATFLEVCRILLVWEDLSEVDLEDSDKKYIYSYDYWCEKSSSDGYGDEVINYIAQKPMKILFPLLLDKLSDYENRIFSSKYYWVNTDRIYLKLVYDNPVPSVRDHDGICELDYNFDARSRKDGGFHYFCSQI
ncbi:TPA: DUF4365 domain-containing protein [Vibrio parahaemolyticus]|uniref:DUF4365 domain-containing protein n=2 Tax=Vibrio parahaemolyticus TaxID=670 RepID=UPI00236229E4|nr:DUF4365 domain-containing protein [Vibrio parahaemolyticus]EIZ1047658.1 DUF4365 domain-containing protein [Vibrio parahaemolyticus]